MKRVMRYAFVMASSFFIITGFVRNLVASSTLTNMGLEIVTNDVTPYDPTI